MASKRFEFILAAKTAGWNYVARARQGLRAFNDEVFRGNSLLADAKAQVAGLLGAYLGFEALRNTAAIIKDANTATFILESALKAASREFENTGSMESWGNTIEQLSNKLRVYSKTDLNQAAARTIDMTKRLGLSEKEMAVVIERTADLSAGKTALVDGIERVTAALRGEAEASEYLGLTLNETYVKSWYEARGALQGAWKDLDDLEKAQIRYQVFLEQASPSIGKAADSVNTLGGAYELVKAKVNDAINSNEEMVGVMRDLAVYIADNADELGELAAAITANVIAVGQWVIENREAITTLGKWALGIYAVTKVGGSLLALFRGLKAAAIAFSGTAIAGWLVKLRGVMAGLTATMGGTFAATMGVAGAFAFAALQVGTLFHNYNEIKKLEEEIEEQSRKNAKANEELAERFREISEATGVVVTSMDELDQAVKDGKLKFDESTASWVAGYNKVSVAASRSAESQKQVTGKALDEMRQAYAKYADEVKRLQDEISSREKSLYEQLRELARTGMDDASAWEDMKQQAEEYQAAAQAAAESGNWSAAVENADKAREYFAKLNTEVKQNGKVVVSADEARATAMKGVKESGELAIKALQEQQKAAKEAMEVLTEKSGWQDLSKSMDDAKKKWLDNWTKMQSAAIEDIEKVEDRIQKLVEKERTIYVNVKEVSSRSTGGLMTVPGYSGGGSPSSAWEQFKRLSSPLITRGSGTKDDVPAMLKRWEFVQPPESVRLYGLRFMEMIRRRLFPVSLARGFATGGTPTGNVSLRNVPGGGSTFNITLNYAGSGSTNVRQQAKEMARLVMGEFKIQYQRSS